jgi:hypothetical protein
MATVIDQIRNRLNRQTPIAPLIIFRIAFGSLMFLSTLRFILKGWVHTMYIAPKMFFPYYGFEWVKPLGETGMYTLFVVLLVSALFITFGFLYRFSIILFFLIFTYVELIDKTNYLNHYYFVSIVSFLMIFIPAGKAFSLDNRFFRKPEATHTAYAWILILQLQMFIVYFFAGIAKINFQWLIEAQPLRLWLPAFSHFPVIGPYMEQDWVAYLFSWFSCIYDLLIGFLLFNRRFVKPAYIIVIIFHLATALFFNIGMFPYIMMTITIIFFPAEFHARILEKIKSLIGYSRTDGECVTKALPLKPLLALFFIAQFLLPFRYLLYKGDLFWTEQGYRFSWRVMLMEKAGTAFYTVSDAKSNRSTIINNSDHLTPMQEKMMSTQPDMMVDYAKYLRSFYLEKGFVDPVVNVESYVTLNGSGTRPFIKPGIDLSRQSNSFLIEKNFLTTY